MKIFTYCNILNVHMNEEMNILNDIDDIYDERASAMKNQFKQQTEQENKKISEIIEKEKKEYQELINQLNKRNEELDNELDFIKSDYFKKKKSLQKIILSQQNNIDALQKTQHSFDSSSDTSEIQVQNLETEINQLNNTSKIVENSIEHVQNEIDETYQMIDAVPSNNSEILEIAKRQIARKIQNQIYNAQEELEEANTYHISLQDEISLSQSLIKGILKENDQFKLRIQEKQKKLDAFQKQNNILSKNLDDSRGLISVSNLKTTLKNSMTKLNIEIAEIENEYRNKFHQIDSENYTITKELDERLQIIEVLNTKIRDLTMEALNAKDEAKKKVNMVKQRNFEEINDIQQRFQNQLENALQNQRNSILASIKQSD